MILELDIFLAVRILIHFNRRKITFRPKFLLNNQKTKKKLACNNFLLFILSFFFLFLLNRSQKDSTLIMEVTRPVNVNILFKINTKTIKNKCFKSLFFQMRYEYAFILLCFRLILRWCLKNTQEKIGFLDAETV